MGSHHQPPTGRTAPQLESMLALQRLEIIRLHTLVDELRQKPDALDLEKRLRGSQRETLRQKHRAEMWRERADLAGWTKQ